MGDPLYTANCFSLDAFKILSLYLNFAILVMMGLGMGLLTQFSLVCKNELLFVNSNFLSARSFVTSVPFLSHVVKKDYFNIF